VTWVRTATGNLINLEKVCSIEVRHPDPTEGQSQITALMADGTQVPLGTGPKEWVEKQMGQLSKLLNPVGLA